MTRQARWIKAHPWYQILWQRNNRDKMKGYAAKAYKKNKIDMNRKRKYERSYTKDVIEQLKYRPCEDCGIQYDTFIMHFDHKDPNKKIKNVSQMTSYSIEHVLNEISKCRVVCANCHGLRTKRAIRNGKVSIFGWRYV